MMTHYFGTALLLLPLPPSQYSPLLPIPSPATRPPAPPQKSIFDVEHDFDVRNDDVKRTKHRADEAM